MDTTTIYTEEKDYIDAPLCWHLEGLRQTASGYGYKLTTRKKYMYKGRAYRVYVSQFSNAGTAYILVRGVRIILA
jgi:hypothetical protein